MNLIYICVFRQESYITLLKLLINSISLYSNIDTKTTKLLIMTSSTFYPLIKNILTDYNSLPINYFILDMVDTLMESSCCKLNIFHFPLIDNYKKIIYLDTDVLINNDINNLFNINIDSDKLYALEEGTIGNPAGYWGLQFFDFSRFDKNQPAFSAGVLYFCNSPEMKLLFNDIQMHIQSHTSNGLPLTACLDQPFVVYNAITQGKYNNQLMKLYLENNPTSIRDEMIIYHFPGGPGNYSSKYDKMTACFNMMLKIFNTRNEMIQYYSGLVDNPAILEIGVFKGEFLDYIVSNCKFGSIDAVDLFEGYSCSGDVDGNNVVWYNIALSYIELNNKYKDMSTINIYKSDSCVFLKKIDNKLYDIIYIDGDHSYEGVKNDLVNSFNKIKNGGYIMGHDYEMNMDKAKNSYNFGVKQAVDEFCSTYNQRIIAKAIDGCVSYCIKINKTFI